MTALRSSRRGLRGEDLRQAIMNIYIQYTIVSSIEFCMCFFIKINRRSKCYISLWSQRGANICNPYLLVIGKFRENPFHCSNWQLRCSFVSKLAVKVYEIYCHIGTGEDDL